MVEQSKKVIFKKVLFLVLLGLGVFVFLGVHAQAPTGPVTANELLPNSTIQPAIGLASADIRITIAKIIRVAFGLLGIIAVGLLLYGGFIYMTAGGADEKVREAKTIITNSVIGLVIILSAYAITSFVISRLVAATTGGPPGHCSDGVQDFDETGVDCGGFCGQCGGDGGGGGGGFGSNYFTVVSLPPASTYCASNVKPAIVFSKPVDLATVTGNITIRDSANNVVPGAWAIGSSPNMIVFTPVGSCAPAGAGNDCLVGGGSYVLTFATPTNIKSLQKNPELSLSCGFNSGCGPVNFKAGTGVDTAPPTVKIVTPLTNSSYPAGTVVPVTVNWTDDKGIQNVSLTATAAGGAPVMVDSVASSQCKTSGTAYLHWNSGSAFTSYDLNATALDFAAGSGSDAVNVAVRPSHCFNNVLETALGEQQLGPPTCGGECGVCPGGTCTNNSQCASGNCQNGVCLAVMQITGFSPGSGAPGTYVSIFGVNFGTAPGHVYFAKVNQPRIDVAADWVEGGIPACGNSVSYWNQGQIITKVPLGTVSSTAIKVETVPIDNGSGTIAPMTDTTNNHNLSNFAVNSLVRPNLCSLTPGAGVTGDQVVLSGANFGQISGSTDGVFFSTQKAVIIPSQNAVSGWSDTLISAAVPGIDYGDVGVKVTRNNVESNSVKFSINSGINATYPIIESITPTAGPAGEYVTILGKNFGANSGRVWFKPGVASDALMGDTTFPSQCQSLWWSDGKIIVKAPTGGSAGIPYYVQVNTADNRTSAFDTRIVFNMQGGQPTPGICGISPASAPIPMPSGSLGVEIYGDYLTPNTSVYFWNSLATNPTLTTGRTAAQIQTGGTSNLLTVIPGNDTITGPLNVYSNADSKMSNAVNFAAKDCTAAANACVTGYQCCASGAEKGECKPQGQACAGQTLNSGYVWRFSTKDIPPSPRVVERCDAATNSGAALPSPSPSILWGADSGSVCKSALVDVEFTAPLNQNTVNANTVKVNRCTSFDNSICGSPSTVAMDPTGYNLNVATGSNSIPHDYLSLKPQSPWEKDVWYQVVLSSDITSDDATSPLPLIADRPCGDGTAYCFYFKGGGQECQLKNVIVTPYSFTSSKLGSPLTVGIDPNNQTPLVYRAGGISSQNCIEMDVSGLDWRWSSANPVYADIFDVNTGLTAKVSAKANTVGVGLPGDAVQIQAAATVSSGTGTETKVGQSPLTINLTDPMVIDWWPKCQEACLNAEVGLKFNVSLSNRNLTAAIESGTVQLLKCGDENCLTTTEVGNSNDVSLEANPPYATIVIANGSSAATALEPNTLYKVTVSASSTNPNTAGNIVWSRGTLADPFSFSKPYNKEFSWRFKTKNSACVVTRVDVNPDLYSATSIHDRSVFSAEPYSSPDSCSKDGQRLNPWQMSWGWTSSNLAVATVQPFSTKGKNPYCDANLCVKRGSTIASNSNLPVNGVCGNVKVEAGEDCDPPNPSAGCGLDCRWLGNSATCGNGTVDAGEACDTADPATMNQCSADCRHLGSALNTSSRNTTSSVCGNGFLGNGEDCDVGITANVSNSSSAMGCSDSCLHTGTKLSSKWCYDHTSDHAGFDATQYVTACAGAISRCGDGETGPDEDDNCDLGGGKRATFCNNNCLKSSTTTPQCTPGEGCGANGMYLGSSLLYAEPSVCGDGAAGSGENPFCESGLVGNHAGFDPWALAVGVGQGIPVGTPPAQVSDIVAVPQNTSVQGKGQFSISCGYKTDADCAAFGPDYGVGKDSCCYARPALSGTLPADGSAAVCLNTMIEADFTGAIDPATLPGNIIIARGTTSSTCGSGEYNASTLFAISSKLPWYERAFVAVRNFFGRMFGTVAEAAPPTPTTWCAGNDVGNANVLKGSAVNTSRVMVGLSKPLALNSYYRVVLKPGITDTKGVSIGTLSGHNFYWQFSTGVSVCEINSLIVNPDKWYFSAANATTTLLAEAISKAGPIQPIAGVYDWNYRWQPNDSLFVNVPAVSTAQNLLTAKNRNGEVDVRAFANLTVNTISNVTGTVANGSSHIVVFLCENPWPPKEAAGFKSFPYQDTTDNHSGYNLSAKIFDGNAIPPALNISGTPAMGDGYFNFSTYYCADKGSVGTFDDWPFLKAAVQNTATELQVNYGACEMTGATCTTDADCSADNTLTCYKYSPLKRFIFTNDANSDGIGLQILPNPLHLNPEAWYRLNPNRGGQGFAGSVQSTIIDGYRAVTDGNNVYIGGLNYTSNGNLYDVIYLFSVNSNASAETKHVFAEMLANLRLNNNIDFNDGYCRVAATNQSTQTKCTTDLDCQSGEICSDQIVKLQRNVQRVRDLKLLDSLLVTNSSANGGKFLSLKEGSYLNGQSVSTWPSWASMGNFLGQATPRDPINILGKAGTCTKSPNLFCLADADCPGDTCTLHDAQTGWSTANSRNSFACNPKSYAYRYIVSPTNFALRSRFENPGLNIVNLDSFLSGFEFSNLTRFPGITDWSDGASNSGICTQVPSEVSSLNTGVCGNGTVNAGEDCDPPGVTVCTAIGGVGKTCDSSCHWQSGANCQGKCGNGILEPGEVCDEGLLLNGTYGHCNATCSGMLSSACDMLDGSPYKLCNTTAGVTKWGLTRADSCNWDCKSYGPYCGDGIVQPPYEECEGAQSCTTADGKSGIASCNLDTCKRNDCVAATSTISVGTCGDGIVSLNEACDDSKNGNKNGVACTPSFNRSCTYCSADCKDVITINSTGYCGNGVFPQGDKQCDFGNALNTNKPCIPGGTYPTAAACNYCTLDCQLKTIQPPACLFAYSAWSDCDAGGNQSRSVTGQTPANCAGTPFLNQSCRPTCQFNYSGWGACRASGTRTRTVSGNPFPTGCVGGTPVLSGTCTPPGPMTFSNVHGDFYGPAPTEKLTSGITSMPKYFSQDFTTIAFNKYNFGARPFVNQVVDKAGTEIGTVIAEGSGYQAGVGPLANFQAVFTGSFVVPIAGDYAVSFTNDDGFIFGVAGASLVSGGKSVNAPATTLINNYPVLSADNEVVKTVSGELTIHFPNGGSFPFELDYMETHVGELAMTLTETTSGQPKDIPIPECSFTYSAYGDCQPSNTQTRTVTGKTPAACVGGTPVLSQPCTYVPPPPPPPPPPAVPSLSFVSVKADFFQGGSYNFTTAAGTTPLFSISIPNILFNPNNNLGFSANQWTQPFTNVRVDAAGANPSPAVAQGNGYIAGGGTSVIKGSWNTVFSGNLRVGAPGSYVIYINSDDGYTLGIGSSGGNAPTASGGENVGRPSSGLTAFNGLPIASVKQGTNYGWPMASVTVNFPAAGDYPFEVDYAEANYPNASFSLLYQNTSGTVVPIPPSN